MSERDLEKIDGLESLKLRDDVGHSGNIQMLIRLCYLSADDPEVFAWRVDILRRSMPTAVKSDEGYQKRLDDCTVDLPPRWVYRYFCNVPMGTPEEPVAGSPYLAEQEPYTDWPAVFELCVEVLEREGVTWKKDAGAGAF